MILRFTWQGQPVGVLASEISGVRPRTISGAESAALSTGALVLVANEYYFCVAESPAEVIDAWEKAIADHARWPIVAQPDE